MPNEKLQVKEDISRDRDSHLTHEGELEANVENLLRWMMEVFKESTHVLPVEWLEVEPRKQKESQLPSP